MAQFLSADNVQGNAQGADPYSYVAGNPETATDPTGQALVIDGGIGNTIAHAAGNRVNLPKPVTSKPVTPSSQSSPNPKRKTVSSSSQKSGGLRCGTGTVREGDTCVSDANSKAGKFRDQKLTDLKHWAIGETIAGYLMYIIGDIILASGTRDLLDWLELGVDIIGILATNILPLLAIWGGASVPSGLYTAAAWLMGAAAGIEVVISAIREGSWLAKTGAIAIGDTIKAGAGGPMGVLVSVAGQILAPIVGNLLDVGGHALVAKGMADFANYTSQENMPILDWCAQYGGCPAGDSLS